MAPPEAHGRRPRRDRRRPRGGVPRLNGPTAIALYLAGGLLVGIGVLGIAAGAGGAPADQPIEAIGRLWGEIIDLLTGR